jgi:hypothetical protein
MTGGERLDNLKSLLEDIFLYSIPGYYTGLWRGGSSIFACAVIRRYFEGNRMSYIYDSFQGLPPGDRKLDPHYKGWGGRPYLEAAVHTVAAIFHEMGLLNPSR